MTYEKDATPINVALFNLDETTQKTFQFFLNSSLCVNASLATDERIDLFILDIDREYNKQFLLELKGSKQYAIILHMDESTVPLNEHVLLLKKPINAPVLVELISEIHSKIYSHIERISEIEKKRSFKSKIIPDTQHSQLFHAVSNKDLYSSEEIHLRFKAHKFVGSNKDISLDDRNNERIYFSKEKYLFYYLQKARKLGLSKKSNIIIIMSSRRILYDYISNNFIYDLDENQLKYLQTSMIISDCKLQFVDGNIFSNSQNIEYKKDEEFIWNATIQASKGRIPKEVSIASTVIMKTWPNFARLQVFRYAVQICALWSNYNLSLFETAKQLEIPQRYVFTLFSAMNALGYAKIDTSNSLTNKVKIIPQSQSLFSRIITHILRIKK